jgi:serpin B
MASAGAQAPRTPLYAVVAASNQLGLRTLRDLAAATPDDNLLVAPTGLSWTFAYLATAADAGARREIDTLFGFGGTAPSDVATGLHELRRALRPVQLPRAGTSGRASSPSDGTLLETSFWPHPVGALSPSFVESGRQRFGIAFPELPEPGERAESMDGWLARVMGTVAARPPRDRTDGLVVLSVARFRGTWSREFRKEDTVPTPFTLRSGREKQIPMMYQRGRMPYLRRAGFQAVSLFYTSGFSLDVFVPDRDSSLAELVGRLDLGTWEAWLRAFEAREGRVGLPRLRASTRYDVLASLARLGLRTALEKDRPVFPGIGPLGGFLENAEQSGDLVVDERGTEASSLLEMRVGVVGIERKEPAPFEVVADRPFLIAIRHLATGHLLFLGAVLDPESSPRSR